MQVFSLSYGTSHEEISIPDSFHPDWIAPADVPAVPDPLEEVNRALSNPLGGIDLSEFSSSNSVAIAINDKTRPVPHHLLLPPLLHRLEEIGFLPDSISLIVATGTHLPMPLSEFPKILPQEIIGRYKVFSHDTDAADLVDLGVSSRGTPIFINRRFMQANLRIVLGNIEPHHFMGFSGGVKTAAIGLAGRSTINQNHALLPHPQAKTGHYADNPMRQEVEEIGKRIGIHFALNAVLNNNKEIVRVIAGDPVAVMEIGIQLARSICQVSFNHDYDLVIASAGGHPKDINLYQSQKALTHAALLTRDNGTVILLAACPEGAGSSGYETFMEGVTSFTDVFNRFKSKGFEVGPHKAFLVARDASRVHVQLYSSMPPPQVQRLLLTPVVNLQQTILATLNGLSSSSRVALMPIATITIPVMDS
jgi:nickel-dependent lactate racemase